MKNLGADRPCSGENCTQKVTHRLRTDEPLCPKHYQRLRRVGSYLDDAVKPYRGKTFINAKGYRVLWRDGRAILEHRYIMQGVLGRQLLKTENIHHKNGIRLDNRPENLEIWTTMQPAGQRVEDVVKWARDILSLYTQGGE